jgi:hypothetical protein
VYPQAADGEDSLMIKMADKKYCIHKCGKMTALSLRVSYTQATTGGKDKPFPLHDTMLFNY